MRTEIKSLHHELKATSVYVTHDQVEAMTMADRIVVMKSGIVEQIGSPLELYDSPVNTFVAGFLGSPAMIFIPGVARRNGHGPVVSVADGAAPLPLPPNVAVQDGQRVIYGVRPEHLDLANGDGGMAARVNVVEPTGADTLVFCKFGGVDVCAEFSERHRFQHGDAIQLRPRAEMVHVFDEASGRRL